MMADVDTVPDDVDTCRICSMPGDDEHPLFYPCKCSGTIKFIHQDCLTTWLEHSKKKKCDVCKHSYAFTNVYADDMPPQLPLPIILKQVATQFASFSIFFARSIGVSLIWLIVVPYTTFLTWRTYFWFGNLLAWCLNSRGWPGPLSPPLGAVSWIFNITAVLSDPSESAPAMHVITNTISSDIFTGQIISTLIVLVILSVFLLREWILQNAPRGVFDEEPVELADQPAEEEALAVLPVAEEVVAQDAAPDTDIIYPGDETPPVDEPHMSLPRPLTPFPMADDEAASDDTLDHELPSGSVRKDIHPHQFDRLIAPLPRSSKTAQRQLRFLETEMPKPTPVVAWTGQDAPVTPMSADSQSSSHFLGEDEDEETLPVADAPRSANTVFSPSTEDEPLSHPIPPFTPSAFQFTIEPAPKRNGSDDSYDAISPGEAENVEAPTTPSAMATPSSGASLQFPASQAQLESPASSSSSQQSVAPPALPPFTPSLFTFQSAGGPGLDTPGAETPPNAERPFEFSFVQDISRTSSSGSDPIVPPQRRFASAISPGGSKRPVLAPTTPSEEIPIALYRAPEDIDNTDEEQRPVSSRPQKRQRGPTEAEMSEYFRRVGEDAGPGPSSSSFSGPQPATNEFQTPPPRPIPRDWSSPSESERTLSEEGEQVDDENQFGDEQYDDEFEWVPPEDGDELELGHDDGAAAELPNLILDDGRGPFVQAGNGQVNVPPADIEFDDGALGDANGEEDFDGVLEAVGLRGPLWAVFQNAAIAAILMDLAILIGVWFPYTIGKTLSLLTLAPRQVLSMINWPIRIVRFISDPIADAGVWLIKDYLFPRVVSILRVLIAVLGSLGGLRVFDAPTAPQAPPSFVLPLPVASNITVPALVNHTQLALDWLQLLPLDNSTAEHFAITFAHWFGRWSSLVEGDSARSRVVAILMGYVWVLAFTAVYVSYTSPTEGREVARVIRRELRQQLIMAKVGIFLAIELLVFPIICGVLLNVVSLPLTPSISLYMRANFIWSSPLTGTFALWLLGTTFMYQFAISLGDCRSLMRDGALWFVKDPQDPASHPIRDIVERPVLSQVRKLSLSMCMYTFFVVFCVGGTILAVVGACNGLLPLRWKVREPLSEVPIDLLFVHFVVPPTLKALRLKQNGAKALKHWWEYMSYLFRLSSYMYGKRFEDEEYTSKKWTWRYLVIPWKPLTEHPDNMQQDGGFLRVPNSDHVILPRNQKRVLIRTNEHGIPNDPVVAGPIIAAQIAEATKENRDPAADWLIVYTPPHFRWRVIGFLFMLWVTATLLVVLCTALPLRVGRMVIALVSDNEYHDLYALTAGAYILGGAWFVGMQIERNPRPWTLARRFLLWAPKALYMVVTIGVILPILLSVTLDLYLFLPIRSWVDPERQPVIRIVHCWATGLVMGRMALYVSRLPRRRANRQQQRDGQRAPEQDPAPEQQLPPQDAPPTPVEDDVPPLPEVQQAADGGQQPRQEPDTFKVMRAWAKIQRHGLRDPHVVDATLDFIVPVAAVLIVAIAIPAAVFCATRWIMPVDIPPTLLTQTVYFTIFVMVFGAGFFSLISEGLAAWTQTIRDQEFLVERRLRNHDIRKK